MALNHLPASATLEDVMASLWGEGYCIVDRLVDEAVVDRVAAELAPYVAKAATGEYEQQGLRTRRCGALIARSPASHQLIMSPLILAAADALLRKKATAFQLSLTQLISIEPGEKAQFLHRDETTWDHFPHFPLDYHVELSVIWALDEFTDENGATRVVPGSHRSERPQDTYTQADTFPAEMPKGSALIYTGKTVHGGGANRSAAPRRAANIDYSVGWLRQEENQYLSVPLEVARTLDRGLARLMGYQMGSPATGYVRDYEDPIVVLDPSLGPVPVDNSLLMDSISRSSIAERSFAGKL